MRMRGESRGDKWVGGEVSRETGAECTEGRNGKVNGVRGEGEGAEGWVRGDTGWG